LLGSQSSPTAASHRGGSPTDPRLRAVCHILPPPTRAQAPSANILQVRQATPQRQKVVNEHEVPVHYQWGRDQASTASSRLGSRRKATWLPLWGRGHVHEACRSASCSHTIQDNGRNSVVVENFHQNLPRLSNRCWETGSGTE
jgi:hypothetical protein